MKRFHEDKEIKHCGECPFCVEMVNEEEDFVEYFCEPIKPKYGHNPVNPKDNPRHKCFCRLTNEVTANYIFDFGAFWGKSIAEVMEVAPKYVEFLLKKEIIILKK